LGAALVATGPLLSLYAFYRFGKFLIPLPDSQKTLPLEEDSSFNKGHSFLPMPGSRILLSQGLTHYLLQGPEDGEPVVLVHGFSGTLLLWKDFSAGLAAKGYRVLSYDICGHGWTSAPDEDYKLGLYVSQLAELSYKLNLKPFYLIGSSMGGIIASKFLETYPDKVKKMVLVAPAGLPVIKPLIANILYIPIICEYLLWLKGRALLTTTVCKEFNLDDETKVKEETLLLDDVLAVKLYQVDHNPNYLRVLLSILQNFPFDNFTTTYREVGRLKTLILLIMGEKDRTIPMEHAETFMDLLKNARLLKYDDAGHYIYLQKRQQMLEALPAFFKE